MIFRYDSGINQWSTLSSMSQNQQIINIIAMSSCIFVIGKRIGDKNDTQTMFSMYAIHTNKWKKCSPMKIQRTKFGIVTLQRFIYVIGGIDAFGIELSSVERYDPITDSWKNVNNFFQFFLSLFIEQLMINMFANAGISAAFCMRCC